MTKRKIVIILSLVVVLLSVTVIIGLIWNNKLKNNDNRSDIKKPFVIPEKVELNLNFGDEGKSFNPYLTLSANTKEKCFADIEVKVEKIGENDINIKIEGYNQAECQGVGNLAVVGEARNRIELAEMIEEGKKKRVKFLLGDVENVYTLFFDKYALYLEPEKAVNVISNGFADNLNGAKTVVVIRNPQKLVYIGVNGTYSADANYNSRLKEIAISKKYVPAKDVLRSFDKAKIVGWDEKVGIAAFTTDLSHVQESEFFAIGKIVDEKNVLDVILEKANIPMNSYSF